MLDRRLEKLAEVLVGYSTRVAGGELVTIRAPTLAAPLVRAVYGCALQTGAHPLPRVTLEELREQLLLEGNEEQLEFVDLGHSEGIERADVAIVIEASANTRSLTNLDPSRIARHQRARRALRERFNERAAAGELRWALTVYPTHAFAQEADLSLAEYEDFVYRAGFLDADDPIAEWRRFGEELEGVAALLGRTSEVRVVAEDTDLTVAVDGRHWVPSKGEENFPDGEVFTGPREDSLEGTIRFTYPGLFEDREVDDVRLRFDAGEVVEASAGRGEELLQQMLELDEGARRAGEFAFGLNYEIDRFTRNTLFDEKIGGTIHLALGSGYPETGSRNRSALHWDLVCDLRPGSEVYADGELIYRDGRFLDGGVSP
jgi:aminopeptidase